MVVRSRRIMEGKVVMKTDELYPLKEIPPPPDESAGQSDSLKVTLRPAKPADEDAIDAFLKIVSSDRIYSRFQTKTAPEGHAQAMAYADGRGTVSILAFAESDGQERLAGIGMYGTKDMPLSTGDVGLLVHQDYQERGLGKMLVRELTSKARMNGLKRLEFMYAADNDHMRRIIASAHRSGLVVIEKDASTYPGVRKVIVSIV